MRWKDEVLIDKVLLFGLPSPFIFTAVADALQWIIEQRGARPVLHYLDDYITISPPDSPQCQHNLHIIQQTCDDLGVPLEEGRSHILHHAITFLGIEIDSTIRLPEDKLGRLCQSLDDWAHRKATRKRDLLSLIGLLQHATKGFLRRLRRLIDLAHQLDGYIRLNLAARSDILWWHTFARQWNGTSMLYAYSLQHPHVHV